MKYRPLVLGCAEPDGIGDHRPQNLEGVVSRHRRCHDEHDVQCQQFHVAECEPHRELAKAIIHADKHGKGEDGVEIQAHNRRKALPGDISAGAPVRIKPRGVGDNQGDRDDENVSAYSAFFQCPLAVLIFCW